MNLTDILTIIVLLSILGVAIGYIIVQHKKGAKCAGCPYGGSCGKKDCDK